MGKSEAVVSFTKFRNTKIYFRRNIKNKLGIFTALILSLIITSSAFAAPTVKVSKTKAAAAAKATTKKAKKHRKRKAMKKAATKTMKAPTTMTTPDKNK